MLHLNASSFRTPYADWRGDVQTAVERATGRRMAMPEMALMGGFNCGLTVKEMALDVIGETL